MTTYDDDAERMFEECEYCGKLNIDCVCEEECEHCRRYDCICSPGQDFLGD